MCGQISKQRTLSPPVLPQAAPDELVVNWLGLWRATLVLLQVQEGVSGLDLHPS